VAEPLEILSVAGIAAADRAAIEAGTPGRDLMERAGAAVAQAIAARWSPRPVTVLCGPGANGGDGYVTARRLAELGWQVTCAPVAATESLRGDAALAAADWQGRTITDPLWALEGAEVVVDALFGAGLSKPLSSEVRGLLEEAERRAPIVAVDLPSGLPGDGAEPLGYAPRCDLTVTFHRKKPAHVLVPSRGFCGEVLVADIGLAPPQGGGLYENLPPLWLDRFPWPKEGGHKHSRGRLGVVAGKIFDTGAARLAARAGLRLAGTVRLYASAEAAAIIATHLEAAMLKTFETSEEIGRHARDMDAMIIGPAAGLNEQTVDNLRALAETDSALIVDADAITMFKERPEALFDLLDEHDVLTPHTGEFERLFPGLLKTSSTRIAAAREAARGAGAVVVLKGPDTVIAAPDGRAAVNTASSPWLATAGSGDVLAGLIGGLLAAHMPAWQAACAGVWIHGAAAQAFGPGLTAEDLPGLVPQVLRELSSVAPTLRRSPN
jgi:ADP-dependent NAD(P)H-hydrate dehydratase / NAD(P)H-hydrate epimerase